MAELNEFAFAKLEISQQIELINVDTEVADAVAFLKINDALALADPDIIKATAFARNFKTDTIDIDGFVATDLAEVPEVTVDVTTGCESQVESAQKSLEESVDQLNKANSAKQFLATPTFDENFNSCLKVWSGDSGVCDPCI